MKFVVNNMNKNLVSLLSEKVMSGYEYSHLELRVRTQRNRKGIKEESLILYNMQEEKIESKIDKKLIENIIAYAKTVNVNLTYEENNSRFVEYHEKSEDLYYRYSLQFKPNSENSVVDLVEDVGEIIEDLTSIDESVIRSENGFFETEGRDFIKFLSHKTRTISYFEIGFIANKIDKKDKNTLIVGNTTPIYEATHKNLVIVSEKELTLDQIDEIAHMYVVNQLYYSISDYSIIEYSTWDFIEPYMLTIIYPNLPEEFSTITDAKEAKETFLSVYPDEKQVVFIQDTEESLLIKFKNAGLKNIILNPPHEDGVNLTLSEGYYIEEANGESWVIILRDAFEGHSDIPYSYGPEDSYIYSDVELYTGEGDPKEYIEKAYTYSEDTHNFIVYDPEIEMYSEEMDRIILALARAKKEDLIREAERNSLYAEVYENFIEEFQEVIEEEHGIAEKREFSYVKTIKDLH